MRKLTIRIFIGLVILLTATLVVVGLSLDGLVKRSVETFGPKITKVDVKLDKVSLSLFSGSGVISGLVVGNPEGFKTQQAISVGRASLALSPASLLSSKIVIKSLTLEAPEITLEMGTGGSNLKKILANVNEATGDTKSPAKPTSTEPGKKLEVDDFLITGAKLHLGITGLGSTSVPVPPIHLTGLGTGDAGITAAELTKQVIAAIEQAAAAGASQNLGGLTKGLTSGATNAAGAAGKIGQGIGDLFKKK